MMRRIAVLITTLITAGTLAGCTYEDEQIELGKWKEQLHDYTNEQDYTYNVDNPFAGSEQKETEGGSLWDDIKQMGKFEINTVVENTVNNKNTIEKNGLISAKLIDIADGDTIKVIYQGEEVYVRLIGINTPESVNPDQSLNTVEGEKASNYTKSILEGTKMVWLELDADPYDEYNRLLAYVWLTKENTNIDTMLNVILLKSGFAEQMTVEPNIKYADLFSEIIAENSN